MSTPTPSTTYAAELGTVDRILPKRARVWVYRVAIALGAIIFVAAIVLDATGHGTIDGVRIDTETGVVGLILSALGTLAHANLSTGPGILEAIESEVPVVAEVVPELEKIKATMKLKIEDIKRADPDLTAMLVKDLRAKAKDLGLTGYSSQTKAELITAIKAATKTSSKTSAKGA